MDKLLNKLFGWGFADEMLVPHVVFTPFDTPKRMKIIQSDGSKIYDFLFAHHLAKVVRLAALRVCGTNHRYGKWIDFRCTQAEETSIQISVLFS